MRIVIFSVVVIVLAGTCWVVAQNAATNDWVSPYNQQRMSPPRQPAGSSSARAPVYLPTQSPETPRVDLPIPPAPVQISESSLEPLPTPVTGPVRPADAPISTVAATDANAAPVVVPPIPDPANAMAAPSPAPAASNKMELQLPADVAVPTVPVGGPAETSSPVMGTPPPIVAKPAIAPISAAPADQTARPVTPVAEPPTIAAPSNTPIAAAPLVAPPPIVPAPPAAVASPVYSPQPASAAATPQADEPVRPVFSVQPAPAPPPQMPPPSANPVRPPMAMPANTIQQTRAAPETAPPAYVLPPDVPQAPVTQQQIPVPAMPQPQAPARPRVQSTVAPALPIIPALPPVPGVQADVVGAPGYVQGVPTANAVGRDVTPLPYPSTTPMNPTQYTTDGPSYDASGQPIFSDEPGRVLGPKVWFNSEYLFWYIKSQSAPPLVQAINNVQPGDTSYAGSQVANLFPGGQFNGNTISGVRGTFGFWLNTMQTVGWEASYFWLGQNELHDTFNSSPNTVLGRPFINADNGQNVLYQVSSIYGVNGVVQVSSKFHAEGGEANFLLNSVTIGPRLNLIAGFRYLQVGETLCVESTSSDPSANIFASGYDSFGTFNQFYGGQVGLRWNYEGHRLLFGISTKIAYGVMDERVRIDGMTYSQTVNGSSAQSGNVLALPTNMGGHNHSTTAYIPEGTASVGFRVFSWATVSMGYNFIYVSNLVRPGKQINPYVTPENLPYSGVASTGGQPSFTGFHQESLWMQGFTAGLTLRY